MAAVAFGVLEPQDTVGRSIHECKFHEYLIALSSNHKASTAPKKEKETRTSGNVKEN